MIEPGTEWAVERGWKLSAAIWVGLVLFALFLGGLILDFSARRGLLLPYYLTNFQRSQLLILLVSPIQFGVSAYVAIRIAKLRDLTDLLRSVDWNPSGQSALFGFAGVAFYGLVMFARWFLFGAWGDWYYGHEPLTVALWLLESCLAQPFIEEFYFRGILFSAVGHKFGAVAAVVSTALLFAVFHPYSRLLILALALLLGITKLKTRSLAACLALHSGYNFGILLFSFLNWR